MSSPSRTTEPGVGPGSTVLWGSHGHPSIPLSAHPISGLPGPHPDCFPLCQWRERVWTAQGLPTPRGFLRATQGAGRQCART